MGINSAQRLKILKETGYISTRINYGFLLGIILIGIGIISYIDDPAQMDRTLSTAILGIVVILILLFVREKLK